MKYFKPKNNTTPQKAALRFLNDIALVDVTLASKLQPSITRFIESKDLTSGSKDLTDGSSGTSDASLLKKLTEYFAIENDADKKAWLDKNPDVVDHVKSIMTKTSDTKNTLLDEDEEDFTIGFDSKDDASSAENQSPLDGEEGEIGFDDDELSDLGSALPSVAVTSDQDKRGILDKIQISTKVRAYLEKQLAEFINEKIHATVVENSVKGYKANYASDGFDTRLDDAFSKLLDVLVETLTGNYK